MATQIDAPAADGHPDRDRSTVTGPRLAYRPPTVTSRPLFERMALNCTDKIDAINQS